MNLADVLEPTFSQPDVLEVTGVSAVTLQTWVNRRLIELAEQHPGTGRRRRYRLVDVARLAIMQQLTALHIGPSTAKAIAEEVTEGMASGRTWAADIVFVVSAPGPDPIIIRAEDEPKEPGHRGRVLVVGDPADVSVWNFDPSESELSGPDVDQARRRVALLETKNGTDRGVPLHSRAFQALARLPQRDGPVFRRPDGGPYATRRDGGGQIKTGFQAACRRAGIVGFTPHDCRHTWATWFYRQTRDLKALMELGGWKSERMVMRYVHVNPDHHRAAIDSLPHGAEPVQFKTGA